MSHHSPIGCLHPLPWESWESVWIHCAHSCFSADAWAVPWECSHGPCHLAEQKAHVPVTLDAFRLQGGDLLRMFWDLFWGCLGNGEKQKIVLITAVPNSQKTKNDIWDMDHGLGQNMAYLIIGYLGWFHLFLPKISLSGVVDSLYSLPHKFGLFMAALLFFFFQSEFSCFLCLCLFSSLCVWHSDLLREGLWAVGILDGMQPLSPAFVLGPLVGTGQPRGNCL